MTVPHQVVWSWPIVAEQALFGLAGGAIAVAALLGLRAKREELTPFIRATYLSSALFGVLGLAILVFELGRPERAPNALINLMVLGTSTMSATVPLLIAFVGATIIAGALALSSSLYRRIHKPLEIILLVLGLGAALQGGLLLQASTFRTFWLTPVLPYIYLVSGLLGGLALLGLLMLRKLDSLRETAVSLLYYAFILSALNLVLIAAHVAMTWGPAPGPTLALLATPQYGLPFYVGVVLLGGLLPIALSAMAMSRGLITRRLLASNFAFMIIGLIALRAVFLFVGQVV